ncbi:protein NLP7-like isoform X2 [Rhododendron vialii]|uniref:protein NLP7-like isoform X2 n=1 Tax=Rhododendron vialii TaxID=182163 RepID=UPI00265F31B2|nr:protein NLP7-like isoform X2 [Rhododendron vialii]
MIPLGDFFLISDFSKYMEREHKYSQLEISENSHDEEDFLPDFKEHMERELKYSRLETYKPDPGYQPAARFRSDLEWEGISWVFWNRQDDDLTLSYDHSVDWFIPSVCESHKVRLSIRRALQKLIFYPELQECLVQFWAPTETKEGRTLLTTQYQPFALGKAATSTETNQLCQYRMGMCREYNNFFYADAESGEEQLGLPGRVFLNKLPESTPEVKCYSRKEYPQRDLALRCEIKGSWALPVFEQSSHTCIGVLEIACQYIPTRLCCDREFHGRMYDIFQEFGLRCFDGHKHYKMQYRDNNKALTAAFEELNMVFEYVCDVLNLPMGLTWVSCRSFNDLLQSQFQFTIGSHCEDDCDAMNLDYFAEFSKVCLLKKGQVTGRILPFPNLLYCSDIKQFSIAESPLVPHARWCELGGWFTICLQSSYTGDELYVLEFFFPKSVENDEKILTRLSVILRLMENHFKTFKLASGQGLGEALSVEVIDFQYGQRSHSIQMIPPASSFIPSLELEQDGGVMLQQVQQDQPSMDAINNGMHVVSETQNYNIPCLDSFKNGKVTTQLDSSDQPSMDPSNNGQNVVTAERNILVVPSSKERKRKMQDRKHKKAGVRIEVSLEEILKCSNMKREDAARELKVSISTFKRVCRGYDIHRWPPRNIENANSFRPSPVENQRQIPQLNSDLPSYQALVGVSHIKPGFQDANMVTIRAKYENNKIKFRLPLSSRFVELQQEVAKRLNLETGTYYVKYKDEEDEEDGLTLIACDEDLQDCMHTSRSLDKTSVVVLLELKQPITNLNPGLSVVPTVHTTGGVWLDAHFSYTPTIDEEETINKCMQDGSFRGEFVDGCWISNITVMEYSEMLDHYLTHCHFFGPNVINFKESGRLLNTILLPKTEKIFFPILRDRHWMLLVIDVKKKYFLWLDSMRCEREEKYSEDFAHFLNHEFVFKRLTEQNEWPIKYPENTPIQDNGNDCGVYMMAYMISLAVGDKLPQFSQAQAKRMRRTICLELKKWDIIPQCPLIDYNFLYVQERKKNELNEKLHKESTAASRDEVFLVSETSRKVRGSSS